MVHLYRRSIKKNGKVIKVWYYWFYDENGKQIRRSCGTDGKPCLTKREAESFVANLDIEKLQQKDITLNDFAKGMYKEDSVFIKNQIAKGRSYAKTTLEQKERMLNTILNKFGNVKVNDLSVSSIENWLFELNKSSSWTNIILSIFNDIYKQLYKARKIDYIPLIEKFKVSYKEKGILTVDEINRLFPADYDEIIKIWRWPTVKKYPDWQIFSFATLIYTALSSGMRSGEIRALKYSQFISKNAVLINSRIDDNQQETDILKKGNQKDKKWRISVLSDRAVQMINHLKEISPTTESKYIFTYKGKFYTNGNLNFLLKKVLNKEGIDSKARNITMHSTRFTYNTIMRQSIKDDSLMMMMGHTTSKMTDYYDKSTIFDKLPELLQNQNIINKVWD